MRSIYFCLTALLLSVLNSCSTEEERPTSYFSLNGSNYELPYGFIDDDGTNSDITYRMYDIFLSNSSDYPENYIEFTILSNSTERLEEGVYSYQYFYEEGCFTYFALGHSIKYDASGEAISGTRMSYYSIEDLEGTITVEKEDGDYKFIFDLTFTFENNNYNLEGMYWDSLTQYSYL